jgi:hypothetical protein
MPKVENLNTKARKKRKHERVRKVEKTVTRDEWPEKQQDEELFVTCYLSFKEQRPSAVIGRRSMQTTDH